MFELNTLERHKDFVGLFPDAANAFNALSRKSAITQMGAVLPGYINYLHLMYGQDADIIITQAGEGISVLNKGTSAQNAIRWIKSRQGTQQGDPIDMTMYACVQRKVLQQTIDFMNQLAKKWTRKHGKGTPKGRAA